MEKVCYIIPSMNSERTIKDCLESIREQDWTPKEIVLVDGGSDDKTLQIARKVSGVRILTELKKGPAAARNLGLKSTKSRYVAFVDSDCTLPPDWTRKCIKELKGNIAGVGGPGVSMKKTSVSTSLDSLLYGKPSGRGFVNSIATMAAVYDRKKIGDTFFDERLIMGEDPEFNFRLGKKGMKLLYDVRLFVYHDHPTTMRGIIKRWYNYGKYYPLPFMMHREMVNGGFLLRLVYMPVLLSLSIISLFYQPLIWLVIAQLAMLFIAYLSIGIARGKGFGALRFSVVHSIKQLAHGLGMIRGFLGGR